MRLILLFSVLCASLAAAGCTSGSNLQGTPTVNETPVINDVLPSLDALSGSDQVKFTSGVIPHDVTNGAFSGSAVVGGGTAQLPAPAGEVCTALYGLSISLEYTVGLDTYNYTVPYLAPYDMTITTDGGGEFWVALADYTTGAWNILPEPFTGTENNIPVGLVANASNSGGSFWWAIFTWDGADVTLTGMDLNYPDAPAAANHEAPLDYHEFIPADDGTLLATNIYLPKIPIPPTIAPPPPYPTILMRTPYSKAMVTGGSMWDTIEGATQLNVVYMLQYFRGRLDDTGAWPNSEGTETMFRDHAGPDHTDAIDTMDWLEARNFYNGDCLLTGPSALGLWIYQAATILGDRIVGIYPQVSSGNVGTWAALRNGCFKKSNVEGWLTGNGYPPELLTEAEDDFANNAHWDELDFDVAANGVNCPGFHEVGWWDVDVESTINSWSEFNTNGDTGAAGNQWLIIGPWHHESVRTRVTGDLTFPDSPGHDPSMITNEYDGIAWSLFMLGRNPFFTANSKNVHYYMVGEEGSIVAPNNTWYTSETWPPAYVEEIWYAIDDPGFGFQAGEPTASTLSFRCDPGTPVPTNGGANLPIPTVIDAGPTDQGILMIHPDNIVLSSGAMLDPLDLAGPINVTLFVETDAADTDIMVKLIDLTPGGDYLLIADSAVRLSWYLNKYTIWPSVTPGQVYQVNMNIGDRAYRFESGHELIMVVQSTNYPRFDINPGNGDALYDGSNGVIQNNTLHVGTGNLSRIILPVFDPSV